MKAPIRIVTLTALAASSASVFPGCAGRGSLNQLDDVESYIQEAPDSALAVLESMDTSSFRSRSDKALFSLLHSMALDKNFIDTTSTDVIMPAVDYYRSHGTPDSITMPPFEQRSLKCHAII